MLVFFNGEENKLLIFKKLINVNTNRDFIELKLFPIKKLYQMIVVY